jgi:5,10-methylene-tetrahydrofolate dehydrogenase/methenyl tetrahydrofolate cyclohydrolase
MLCSGHIPDKEEVVSAQIIDGKVIADRMQGEIAAVVTGMRQNYGVVPGLAAILVGDNPASRQYVGMKRKRCASVGMESFGFELPASTSQEEMEALIRQLNADPKVHGILVQLPLPDHINEEKILSTVALNKDVDGFHPINIGNLAMKGREPLFVPATPYGCMVLLDEVGAQVSGANAAGADASKRHRHDLSQPDEGFAGGRPAGRYPADGSRAAGDGQKGLGEARGYRHRCRF